MESMARTERLALPSKGQLAPGSFFCGRACRAVDRRGFPAAQTADEEETNSRIFESDIDLSVGRETDRHSRRQKLPLLLRCVHEISEAPRKQEIRRGQRLTVELRRWLEFDENEVVHAKGRFDDRGQAGRGGERRIGWFQRLHLVRLAPLAGSGLHSQRIPTHSCADAEKRRTSRGIREITCRATWQGYRTTSSQGEDGKREKSERASHRRVHIAPFFHPQLDKVQREKPALQEILSRRKAKPPRLTLAQRQNENQHRHRQREDDCENDRRNRAMKPVEQPRPTRS